MNYKVRTINHREKPVKVLFTNEKSLPALFSLIFTIYVTRHKSLNTQHYYCSGIKSWYEFWYNKYHHTFDQSLVDNNYTFDYIINEIPNYLTYLEFGSNIKKLAPYSNNKDISQNTINNKAKTVRSFLEFLLNRYLSSKYDSNSSARSLRAARISLLNQLKSTFNAYSGNLSNRSSFAPNSYKFKSINPKILNCIFKIVRPSIKSENVNIDNPWLNIDLQIRNYIIIKILLEYGLRSSELLLLTLDSIKPNLTNNRYSLVISTPLEKDPRRLSIKKSNPTKR